jgi:hypothetical protein
MTGCGLMDWFKRTDNVDIMMVYVDPRNGHGLEKSKNHGKIWRFPKSWGSVNSWMVYFMDPNLKWMIMMIWGPF